MAMAAKVPVVPIVIRDAEEVRSLSSRGASPGTIQVAVLPPVRVDDWTLRDLDRHIDSVRQQFVRTLASWPRGAGRHRTRRKQT
jgi:putative phosphoserine phosphatase/1-acylglycerol-3-phosphate O-acyltransferase